MSRSYTYLKPESEVVGLKDCVPLGREDMVFSSVINVSRQNVDM